SVRSDTQAGSAIRSDVSLTANGAAQEFLARPAAASREWPPVSHYLFRSRQFRTAGYQPHIAMAMGSEQAAHRSQSFWPRPAESAMAISVRGRRSRRKLGPADHLLRPSRWIAKFDPSKDRDRSRPRIRAHQQAAMDHRTLDSGAQVS